MTAIETFEVEVHNQAARERISFQGHQIWKRGEERVYVAIDGRIFMNSSVSEPFTTRSKSFEVNWNGGRRTTSTRSMRV